MHMSDTTVRALTVSTSFNRSPSSKPRFTRVTRSLSDMVYIPVIPSRSLIISFEQTSYRPAIHSKYPKVQSGATNHGVSREELGSAVLSALEYLLPRRLLRMDDA